MRAFVLWLVTGVLLVTACRASDIPPTTATVAVSPSTTVSSPVATTEAPLATPLTANLTEGCVSDYDPTVDYFPEKATFEQARGVTIEYARHYKVVTVTDPWRGAEETFRYILVQCGTPIPEDVADALVIEVPVNRVIAMSATHLPHLEMLGVLDRLVGFDDFTYISNAAVRAKADAGELVEIGSGAELNVEVVLDVDPDLVMTFGVGLPDYDSHPALLEAGIPTVLNSEYREATPLARAEWLKFTATFFNLEGVATAAFEEQVTRYNELAALTAAVTERPTVFTGALRGDAWSIPNGGYLAAFLHDAGAAYLWTEDIEADVTSLDFETVLDRAVNADYWLNSSSWQSLEEGRAADERYTEFAAFQIGQVYNNNARVNEYGANEYWGSGVTHPDAVLADLIKIFHPELLPNHDLIYYHQLGEVNSNTP